MLLDHGVHRAEGLSSQLCVSLMCRKALIRFKLICAQSSPIVRIVRSAHDVPMFGEDCS